MVSSMRVRFHGHFRAVFQVSDGRCCAVFQAIPVIFIHTRHFSISNDGLIFIGIGIGSILAAIVNLWFLRPYPRLLKEWYGFPPAEERLYSAMLGGPILAIGILWLGWSGNYESVPWWVPGLSTILIGLAITLVFISFIVRLTALINIKCF
jgi:MFS transporter, DHA1 family, multidrug resistance protein